MRFLRRAMNAVGKLLLIVALAAFTLVLFSPNVIARYLQAFANRVYLDPIGYRLSFEGFKGDLLGTMEFAQISVTARDGSANFEANDAGFNIDVMRLIRRDLSFDAISVDSMHAKLPEGSSGTIDRIPLESLPWMSVDELNIGSLMVESESGVLWARVQGKLGLTDKLRLDDGSIDFVYPSMKDTVHIVASRLDFDGAVLTILAGGAEREGNGVALDGTVQLLPEIQFDLKAAGTNLASLESLPEGIELTSFQGQVNGSPAEMLLELSFEGSAQGRAFERAIGRLVIQPDLVKIGDLSLAIGEQQISISGEYGFGGQGQIYMTLLNANPADLLPGLPDATIDGSLSLTLIPGNSVMETVGIALNISGAEYDQHVASNMRGTLWKRGDLWEITDTLATTLAGADLQFFGSVDNDAKISDLEVYLQTDTLESILTLLGVQAIEGAADGQMLISGALDHPTLTGAMRFTEMSNGGATAAQSFVQFVIDDALANPNGRVQASFGDIDLFGTPAEGAEFEIFVSRDSIRANYIRLYQGVERLETSGYARLQTPRAFVMDTLSVTRNTESLMMGEVALRESPDGQFAIDHAIKLAGGTIALAGQGRSLKDMSLSWNVDSLDLAAFYRFMDRPAKYQGLLNTSGTLVNRVSDFAYSGTLTATDGFYGLIPFSKVSSDFEMNAKTLSMNSLEWDGLTGGWETSGIFLYGHEPENWNGLGNVESIALNGRLDNYEFNELQPVMGWTMETKGLVSGTFLATGHPTTPHYIADLGITTPRFGLITGNRLSGHLDYADEVLTFKNVELNSPSGNYTGGGYIPAQLAPVIGPMATYNDRPVEFIVKGATSELDFITPYFDEIDLLKGEYRLELGLSGTFADLRRDGWMEVRGGRIELFAMENPITWVEGRIDIVDNILTATDLTARTPQIGASDMISQVGEFITRLGGKSAKPKDPSRVELAGTMDMTSFFEPRFNLRADGDRVYFATPLQEIEAVGNAQFTITGKDTILIEGDFLPEPNALIIKSELAGPELYLAPEQQSGALIVYNIRVPFYSGAVVKNDQIDAEVEGEITLTAAGSEEFRFAGSMDISTGNFDWNGFNFEVLEGNVQFDPSEFNPQFYVVAVTEVEAPPGNESQLQQSQFNGMEEITLTLAGKLDEPIVDIQSPSYTQSDLLQLFALGNTSLAESGATEAATWSLSNLLLREFERDAQRTVGLDRLQILAGRGTVLPGESAFKVNLGKRLSSKLYVGVKADPTLSFDQYQYRVAYRLNRNMSLEGSIDPATGLSQANIRLKYRY